MLYRYLDVGTFTQVFWLMLGSCASVAAVLGVIGDRIGRWVFAIAAAPLLLTTAWSVASLSGSDSDSPTYTWVRELDLVFAVRNDSLGALLAMTVAGIGVLVCCYSAGYFTPATTGIGRFAATILAFATAMLGLVMADTAWTFFAFWEATSIASFLLVGHQRLDPVAQKAARRALTITAGGGLVLLAGFVMAGQTGATTRLSQLGPVEGGAATAAAVLIMIAAATKSAQVPFHMWLPGAMAAPTPVSAYLHSATMVKAGVVLVAVLSPAFADVPAFTVLGIGFGAMSMVWGAIGALRHLDAKLILAWGTISQLGLLIILFSLGNPKATFAGVAILVAHAVFKAALFMIVGEIDVRTGTRDIRELSGLWRSMPIAFGVAAVSAASMAGAPPLLGFAAKEAAIEAALGLAGLERVIIVAIIVGGSALTVAYSLRFMITVFGGSPGTLEVKPRRIAMTVPASILGAGSVLGFVLLGTVTGPVGDAATNIDTKSSVYQLLRWPGLTTAFVVSAGVLVVGAALGVAFARRVEASAPAAKGADMVDAGLNGLVKYARRVAGVIQHGSLPGYVLVIASTASLATIPFWSSIDVSEIVWFDNWAQPGLVVMLAVCTLAATRVSSRLGAALVLGATGLVVTALFVAHGALDLVLTQLLVEIVIVVGFVLGLRRLGSGFPRVGALWMSTRIAVSCAAAGAVGAALFAAGTSSDTPSSAAELTKLAIDDGGGKNIVNVILTDVRALDTLGEIVVLIAVAVGIAALTVGRADEGPAT